MRRQTITRMSSSPPATSIAAAEPIDSAGAPLGAARCRICSAETMEVGQISSSFSGRSYELRRCPSCQFAFVANPWLDMDAIYDEAYYRGRGSDPLVAYVAEQERPATTIRRHEWRGVLARVASLTSVNRETAWLDFGCGTGGLVQFLRASGLSGALGFEQGWGASYMRDRKLPVISDEEVAASSGRFDVVTAIEVIEHVPDPVSVLRRIRACMKPGGLLFLTTGNAAPFRSRLTTWRYVVPDVHIAFFEPETLAGALRRAQFQPAFPGYGPGWDDIMRFKVLKAIRRSGEGTADWLVPWPVVARLADWRIRLTAQPIGWAR